MQLPPKYCPNPECPDLLANDLLAEYRHEIQQCPSCATTLIAEVPEWARPPEPAAVEGDYEYSPLVAVGPIENPFHAPILKSMLEGEGIRYHIENEHRRMGFVGGGFGYPTLTVEAECVEEVRKLMAQLQDDWDGADQEEIENGPPDG